MKKLPCFGCRHSGVFVAIGCAAWMACASCVSSVAQDRVVAIKAPEPDVTLKHPREVTAISLDSMGNVLATSTPRWEATGEVNENGKAQEKIVSDEVFLWDTKSGALLRSWRFKGGLIQAMAFSPDSQTLATGGGDSIIRLWNVKDGKLSQTFTGHTKEVRSLAFAPHGKTLASGSHRIGNRNFVGELYLWNLDDGLKREIIMEDAGGIETLAFSNDGQVIVAPLSQFQVGLWNTQTLVREQTFTVTRMNGIIIAVAISPDKSVVATGSMGHNLRLWDVATGQPQVALLELKKDWKGFGPSGTVKGLAFRADGKGLISAGATQDDPGGFDELLLWDLQTKQIEQQFSKPETWGITLFASSQNATTVAVASSLSKVVRVWKIP